jgi:hypothetical protein
VGDESEESIMMNWRKALLLAALVAGSAVSGAALAHHGRGGVGVGVVIGAPWVEPGYYYPPYYAYPRYYAYPDPIVVRSAPVYIEQGEVDSSAPAEEGSWYYCRKSKAYYPYVKECPGGWQKVAPRPPSEE